MVFVHSMPIDDYMDTRPGDTLKHYCQTLQVAKANDCFISADFLVTLSEAGRDNCIFSC